MSWVQLHSRPARPLRSEIHVAGDVRRQISWRSNTTALLTNIPTRSCKCSVQRHAAQQLGSPARLSHLRRVLATRALPAGAARWRTARCARATAGTRAAPTCLQPPSLAALALSAIALLRRVASGVQLGEQAIAAAAGCCVEGKGCGNGQASHKHMHVSQPTATNCSHNVKVLLSFLCRKLEVPAHTKAAFGHCSHYKVLALSLPRLAALFHTPVYLRGASFTLRNCPKARQHSRRPQGPRAPMQHPNSRALRHGGPAGGWGCLSTRLGRRMDRLRSGARGRVLSGLQAHAVMACSGAAAMAMASASGYGQPDMPVTR